MCELKPIENKPNDDDPREDFFRKLSGTILMSNVEDILEEHGIKILDSNRTGDETEASLFGDAYYTAEDELCEMLRTRFGTLDEQREFMESNLTWKPGDELEMETHDLYKASETLLGYIPFVPPLLPGQIEIMSEAEVNRELECILKAAQHLEIRYKIIEALSEHDYEKVKEALSLPYNGIVIERPVLERQIADLMQSNVPEESKHGLSQILNAILAEIKCQKCNCQNKETTKESH
jgi:hypothetical protein